LVVTRQNARTATRKPRSGGMTLARRVSAG